MANQNKPVKKERVPRPAPNLQHFRKEAGKTQQECADAIGVSQPSIVEAEGNPTAISQPRWYALADFLGCDPQQLQGYKPLHEKL